MNEDKDLQIAEQTRQYMELLLDAGCSLEYIAQAGHQYTALQYHDPEQAKVMWQSTQILMQCSRAVGIDTASQIIIARQQGGR